MSSMEPDEGNQADAPRLDAAEAAAGTDAPRLDAAEPPPGQGTADDPGDDLEP